MSRKYIYAVMITILLVACGQNPDQSIDNQQSTNDHQESVAAIQEKEMAEKATDSSEASDTSKKSSIDNKTNESTNTNSLADLKVHYIDVGQGDATLFQYKDKDKSYNILFDTGDWRGNEVVSYLSTKGVSSIDLVIVSHPDADHSGQLAEVVNTYDVGEVWMSGNESSSDTFQHGLEAVLTSDAEYDEPRTGDKFDIGPMNITILHPGSISGASNEESVSALFTYGEVSFLFTGDADRNAEMQMVNSGMNIDADILQLGHHGSNTSSAPAFIEAVSPEIAIYSAGTDNQYGHPHAEVVSHIQNTGIALYGTDVHGTIVVTTDGNTYNVQTKEDGTISPKSTDSANNETKIEDTSEQSQNTNSEQLTSNCININQATAEELQEIIHIGPARAEDLIELQPFQSVDDLTRISGIGPSRIADIKSQGLACTGG